MFAQCRKPFDLGDIYRVVYTPQPSRIFAAFVPGRGIIGLRAWDARAGFPAERAFDLVVGDQFCPRVAVYFTTIQKAAGIAQHGIWARKRANQAGCGSAAGRRHAGGNVRVANSIGILAADVCCPAHEFVLMHFTDFDSFTGTEPWLGRGHQTLAVLVNVSFLSASGCPVYRAALPGTPALILTPGMDGVVPPAAILAMRGLTGLSCTATRCCIMTWRSPRDRHYPCRSSTSRRQR